MRDTGLVLVDGMPGTGKSTAAQFVCSTLRESGLRCRWHHEERAAHPVQLFYSSEQHASGVSYAEEAIARWSSYAEELGERDQVDVLDAALLQNHVRSMLLFDCERHSIFDLARRIEERINPVMPVFVYMRPTGISELFERVSEVRGGRLLDRWIESQEQFPYARNSELMGYDGFLSFWREFRTISDQVFENLAIPKLRLDISGSDWNRHYDQVLSFLNVLVPAGYSVEESLERFAGTYRESGDECGEACVLHVMQECLLAINDRPTLDIDGGPIGCFREVRLVPCAPMVFNVAGWPHKVEFDEDASRAIVGMRVIVSEEGWISRTRSYNRQQ